MRRIVSTLLFMIVTFAYCYESAAILIKALKDTSVVCVDDMDCEHEDSETEKSKQKEDKLFLACESRAGHETHLPAPADNAYRHPQNSDFSSSDYSQVIYSPPDRA